MTPTPRAPVFLRTLTRRAPLRALVFGAAMAALGTALLLQSASAQARPEPKPLTKDQLSSMSLQDTYRTIADRSLGAVVSLQVESVQVENEADSFMDDDFFRFFFGPGGPGPRGGQPRERKRQSFGSGFLISADGYLISNDHVVKNARKVTVKFNDGREFEAKVIGSDPDTDLALLKIEGKDFPSLPLGDSDALRVGDIVVAIGNPFGLASTFTTGVVSAKGRNRISEGPRFQNFIQTDVAINPGNSGGPLINIFGEVVGINSMIFSQSGGSMGISFSIPVAMAKDVVNQLRSKGSIVRGWIGVRIEDLSPERAKDLDVDAKGAYVPMVEKGGPADKAGMKAGDIVVRFGGKAVEGVRDLIDAVGVTAPGTAVPVEVRRGSKLVPLTVTVEGRKSGETAASESGDKPGAPAAGFGITVADRAEGGAEVKAVDPASEAARKGLRPGDAVLRVGDDDVRNAADFQKFTAGLKPGSKTVLWVLRGNAVYPLVLRVKP